MGINLHKVMDDVRPGLEHLCASLSEMFAADGITFAVIFMLETGSQGMSGCMGDMDREKVCEMLRAMIAGLNEKPGKSASRH